MNSEELDSNESKQPYKAMSAQPTIINFAYGSNMLTGRLQKRVPSAESLVLACCLRRRGVEPALSDAVIRGVQFDAEIVPADRPCRKQRRA